MCFILPLKIKHRDALKYHISKHIFLLFFSVHAHWNWIFYIDFILLLLEEEKIYDTKCQWVPAW